MQSAEFVEKLIIKGPNQHEKLIGRETKSVQVAEWFGRKEAWSAEKAPVAEVAESESLRRHEMERGSERGAAIR